MRSTQDQGVNAPRLKTLLGLASRLRTGFGRARKSGRGQKIQVQMPPETECAAKSPPAAQGSISDEEVVLRVLGGDTALFEILMRRYNQRLFRVARALVQNDADAEDAVQQAYVNAYRHLNQFEGRSRFVTWLTRIVVYQALTHLRRARGVRFEPADQLVESAASGRPDPERQAYVGELSALLHSALAALPDRYRSVFMLREVHGLDTADTAHRLRLTEGAVKTRLHRAKDLLQRKLQDVTPTEAFRFDGARCDRLVAMVMTQLPHSMVVARPMSVHTPATQ